jgi:subtilisin family serine protease
MPNASTGVSGFRLDHPTWDGRGVLIAILDSGVDPGIEGLQTTSTGEPKILDLRDVSGEGDITLTQNADGSWRGALAEIHFGDAPAADFNGNGTNTDTFSIEVAHDSAGGWKARIDTNHDGSLTDETWLHDFLVHRETFTFAAHGGPKGPITGAINLSDESGRPKLAVYLETSGHGSHVAGIASAHNIYGVSGFNGVAPGAQIIGVRIADNSRGGISTTGSMLRGMQYAYRFAQERHLPLVMNMSFGVGNSIEGRAAMDSIVDAFLIAHPDVFFAIAAGNDGPGMSSLGEPGSSELAMSVGATYPAALATLQFQTNAETLASFSSRGGESAKPDIVAPGIAYSTVPGWNIGGEVKGGTSMATPHVTGLAAVLASAMIQEGKPWTAASIRQALRATARPLPGQSYADEGPGLANVEAAYDWLHAGHAVARFRIEALPNLPATEPGMTPAGRDVAPVNHVALAPGAYHRGLAVADSVQRFRVSEIPETGRRADGQTGSYRLVSDAAWLRVASSTAAIDSRTGSAVIEAHYDRAALTQPGRYVGTIFGFGADSAAGPAFVLENAVMVPARSVSVRRQTATGGTAARYYVDVPEHAGNLTALLSITDTSEAGTLYFFEPSGRPARGISSEDVGKEAGRRVTCTVSAEDMVPGIWEIVVQATPGKDLHYDLDARVSSIEPAQALAGAISVRSVADTTVNVGVSLIGVAKSEELAIENGAPVRRTVSVPEWATRIVVDVEVTPEIWTTLTDFGVTVYDSAGAQLGNGPMNYPTLRLTASLPEHRAANYSATVELFPAFANPVPPARVPVKMRIRLEADARAIVAPSAMHLGRTAASIAVPPQQAPAGWQPLVSLRAGADGDEGAMTQIIMLPAGR